MKTRKRSAAVVALAAGLALVAAACGSDSESKTTSAESTPTTAGSATTAAATTTAGGSATTTKASTAPSGTASTAQHAAPPARGMTITYEINPDAVWDDGSPITVEGLPVRVRRHDGHDRARCRPLATTRSRRCEQGKDDHEVVVNLKTVYAPYKNLFSNPGPLKAAAFPNGCKDVSADMQSSIPFASRPYKMDSWSPDQVVFVTNDKYWGDDVAKVGKVVMVPKADSDTELASIKSGEVDFIFPQAFAGTTGRADRPEHQVRPGVRHQLRGAVLPAETAARSPTTRSVRASPTSIDREARPEEHLRPDLPAVARC